MAEVDINELAPGGLGDHLPSGDPNLAPGPIPVEYPEPKDNIEAALDPATTTASPVSSLDSWRDEVAARLQHYRTRRKPRSPRYPSLSLPFDTPESWGRSTSSSGSAATARAEEYFVAPLDASEEKSAEVRSTVEPPTPHSPATAIASEAVSQPFLAPQEAASEYPPEQSSNVIEFPRSAAIPIFRASELADPVFDRPRIVEAPEILPPPPALGGILIEPLQRESADRRTNSSLSSPAAAIAHRALAGLVDALLVGVSLAAFAAVVLRFNPVRGPLPVVASALSLVGVLLWGAYRFLFLVYTGSTPGLRLARLKLVRFDGSPVNRRTRRWRVLASFLSALSAGLGYIWCVLDQEGLCWHDRITRSYITPATRQAELKTAK